MIQKLNIAIDHAEENSVQLDRAKAILNATERWIEDYSDTTNAILLIHVATDIVCEMREATSDMIDALYEVRGDLK